jgi:hypothetical protein
VRKSILSSFLEKNRIEFYEVYVYESEMRDM